MTIPLSSTRSITSTAETSVCRSKCIYITYLDRSCQLERERPTADSGSGHCQEGHQRRPTSVTPTAVSFVSTLRGDRPREASRAVRSCRSRRTCACALYLSAVRHSVVDVALL